MKHYADADAKFIDQFTDYAELEQRMPNRLLTDHVEAVADMKQLAKEISVLGKLENTMGWSRDRTRQRVASIPSPIVGAMRRIDEEFFSNKEKFYRWLDQHPEYDMRGKVGA